MISLEESSITLTVFLYTLYILMELIYILCSLGDSGGPVVTYVNAEPLLVGIVSSSRGCATTEFPALNTKVSEMISFLRGIPAVFKTNI